MDKIRKFDRQWKQVHENDFLLGKICAGVECGCGMLCMLAYKPAELNMFIALDGNRYCLRQYGDCSFG